jgi:hypothetical protein
MPKPHSLEFAQQFAAERGGLCLSAEYKELHGKLKWQCHAGHVWETSLANLQKGHWCPECRKLERQAEHLRNAQQLAAARGGECLSESAPDHRASLIWRCNQGHVWTARRDQIAAGGWCPVCRYERMRHDLAHLQEVARQRGGECLGTEYRDVTQYMHWRCAHGHVWEAQVSRILIGHWCPECVHESLRLGIGAMRELARSRGGECLSEVYHNAATKLLWRCAEGHEWWATPSNMQRRWCAVCAKAAQRAARLQYLKEVAQARGGDCLSDEYIPRKKLLWQCKLGHVWPATSETILQGSWCPECYHLSQCLHDEAREKYLARKKAP